MDTTRVLIDLNTQRDFLAKDGAATVNNRRGVLPRIRLAIRWAKRHQVPIISTIDAHRPNEINGHMAPHCVDGTPGQGKMPFTLLTDHVMVQADNTLDLPANILEEHGQILLRKRTPNIMSNPKADRLFSDMTAEHVYIMGVSIEQSVKPLALSLLARGRNVSVLQDSCGWWSEAGADLAFRQLAAKGVNLLETGELLAEAASTRHHKPVFSKQNDLTNPPNITRIQ